MSTRATALLFLLLLLTRAALVLTLSDVFFYGEELGKGAAAKAILDGIGLEHHRLNYAYHEGGGFLVTHLKALAFLLVGENVLAHKLVALFTTSVLLGVGLLLVREHFGGRAAALFGLLFVLGPGPWQRFSLLSLGTHFEALILIALVLHFATRILYAERARLSDWTWLGLLSGLGLYFSLQCAAASATAGLCLLVGLRRRLFGRGILVAAAGFAVGAAPLWWMLGRVGLEALRVQGHEGLGQGPSGWAAWQGLLRPLVLEPDVLAWTWILACLLLAPAGFSRRSRPILVYLALFIAFYVLSGFAAPNHGHWMFWLRLAPVWFFATVLLSAGLARLFERPGWKRELAAGACALLLFLGVADFTGSLLRASPDTLAQNWRTLCRMKGYDFIEYFDRLVHHIDGKEEHRIGVLRRFRDDPRYLAPAITHSVFEHAGIGLHDAIAISRRAFDQDFDESLLGLGLVAAPGYGHDVPAAFERIESAPEETRRPLAEAIGRVALGLKIEEEKIDAQCRMDVDARWREAFLRGAGWRLWKLHRLRPDRASHVIERQPAASRGPLRQGYADARAAATLTP